MRFSSQGCCYIRRQHTETLPNVHVPAGFRPEVPVFLRLKRLLLVTGNLLSVVSVGHVAHYEEDVRMAARMLTEATAACCGALCCHLSGWADEHEKHQFSRSPGTGLSRIQYHLITM
jgi:hypothetical protein